MESNFEHTFHTLEGELVGVRAITSSDARYLVDLFNHMGPESRYLRFNISLRDPDPELVWSEARRLIQIDPEKDGAWLAFVDMPEDPETAVAGARYVRLDETTAEASLAVRDDMQRKGIGTGLLWFLVEKAQQAGIRKLMATVQRGNRPLWNILKRSPFLLEYESEGSSSTITVHLDVEKNAA